MGFMCPHCERRLPARTAEKHLETCRSRLAADEDCTAPPPKDDPQCAMKSFEQLGVVWRPGMRVRTRCVLAGRNKREYPAGSTGCVYRIIEQGLVLVWLDNDACDFLSVEAEPRDLISISHYLAPQTRCRVLPLDLTAADGETMHIKNGTSGVVRKHLPDERAYQVVFPAHKFTACVPENLVMPVVRPAPAPGIVKRFFETLSGNGGARRRLAAAKATGDSALLESPLTDGGSPEIQEANLTFNSEVLDMMSDDGDPDYTQHESRGVSNLSVSPTYSCLSRSPNSARLAFGHASLHGVQISPTIVPDDSPKLSEMLET